MLGQAKKDSIAQDLLQGCCWEEIAEKYKVSVKTVGRIKKGLAESDPSTVQIISENKCNIRRQKSEQKFLDRIAGEQTLFEDPVEGWVYHLTAEQLRHKQSSKWWSFIIYPESAPENWVERLKTTGCQFALSPLHDKDVWGHDSPEVVDPQTGEIIEKQGSHYHSGDRKKEHRHGLIKFDRTMSYASANDLIREITGGPYIQKCLSLKGQYEYFIHLNNPEKYQYEKDEIEKFNGFIIEPTESDRMVMVDEIGRTIAENCFIDLGEVRAYYNGQYEYINVLALKAFYFEKLTQVNFRRKYPEGRVQQVKLVNERNKI